MPRRSVLMIRTASHRIDHHQTVNWTERIKYGFDVVDLVERLVRDRERRPLPNVRGAVVDEDVHRSDLVFDRTDQILHLVLATDVTADRYHAAR